MRVLDLGCGSGNILKGTGASPSDEIIGVEIQFQRLQTAVSNFRERKVSRPPRSLLSLAGKLVAKSDDAAESRRKDFVANAAHAGI